MFCKEHANVTPLIIQMSQSQFGLKFISERYFSARRSACVDHTHIPTHPPPIICYCHFPSVRDFFRTLSLIREDKSTSFCTSESVVKGFSCCLCERAPQQMPHPEVNGGEFGPRRGFYTFLSDGIIFSSLLIGLGLCLYIYFYKCICVDVCACCQLVGMHLHRQC